MREYLTAKLLQDVEGTCTGRYFIICVMEADNISLGRIVPGSGIAEFTISYKAVVWRPFKGETVSCSAKQRWSLLVSVKHSSNVHANRRWTASLRTSIKWDSLQTLDRSPFSCHHMLVPIEGGSVVISFWNKCADEGFDASLYHLRSNLIQLQIRHILPIMENK